jgi:hypothetical protein
MYDVFEPFSDQILPNGEADSGESPIARDEIEYWLGEARHPERRLARDFPADMVLSVPRYVLLKRSATWRRLGLDAHEGGSLLDLVLNEVARGWGCAAEEILRRFKAAAGNSYIPVRIGTKTFGTGGRILMRP